MTPVLGTIDCSLTHSTHFFLSSPNYELRVFKILITNMQGTEWEDSGKSSMFRSINWCCWWLDWIFKRYVFHFLSLHWLLASTVLWLSDRSCNKVVRLNYMRYDGTFGTLIITIIIFIRSIFTPDRLDHPIRESQEARSSGNKIYSYNF